MSDVGDEVKIAESVSEGTAGAVVLTSGAPEEPIKRTRKPRAPKLTEEATKTPGDLTTARASTITVMRSVKLTDDEDSSGKEETIEAHVFATTPAEVYVEIPLKITRSFQSLGITVGVRIPCYKEETETAIELAFRTALTRIHKEIPNLQTMLESLKK